MPGDRLGGARSSVLGVVMLNTNFPRLPGDIGNPESFPFSVLYRRVEAASVARVTAPAPADRELRGAIVQAARDLEAEGATLIATSCGFLGGLQGDLERAVEVPVATSSLVLLPFLEAIHGAGRVGVLTFDARNLKAHHFPVAPTSEVPLAGLEQGDELFHVISQDREEMNEAAARDDCLAAAARLLRQAPRVRALLLECTNISPFRQDIRAATGLPLYDLVTVLGWIARA